MKNIDFLPNRFRESYAARTAIVRRWSILLGIAVCITPLAIYQYLAHSSVVHHVVFVEPAYQQAQAKSQRLAELHAQLQQVRGEAALLAWLNHPWPRSQVLAHIQGPLPESARLTGIKIGPEAKNISGSPAGGGRTRAARRAEPPAETDKSKPPAEKDLERMHEQWSQTDIVVVVQGVTVNSTELHTYVARLRTTGMFDKSELRSLESVAGEPNAKTQNFELRLILAPGHGVLVHSTDVTPAVAQLARWP